MSGAADDGWPGAELEADYEAWCAEQEARGELAGVPEQMGCPTCHLDGGGWPTVPDAAMPQRTVVKLGTLVDRADPTQTYVLSCGHTVM